MTLNIDPYEDIVFKSSDIFRFFERLSLSKAEFYTHSICTSYQDISVNVACLTVYHPVIILLFDRLTIDSRTLLNS